GLTFGGALKKDKTFYFFSYEYTQREETGFSSIGSASQGQPFGVDPATGLTPDQEKFFASPAAAALGTAGQLYEAILALPPTWPSVAKIWGWYLRSCQMERFPNNRA